MATEPRRVTPLPPAPVAPSSLRPEALPGEPLRGDIHVTASMEMLQTGYLRAVAAAAGCAVAKPFPDAHGTDYNVSHGSTEHVTDPVAEIRVQLKATSTVSRANLLDKTHFSFPLENTDLIKLNASPVTITRLLVVLLLPKDQAKWLRARHDELTLQHCAYWVNLEGVPPTGRHRTTVSVALDHVFDDHALCEIMRKVGAGKKPR